MSRPPPKLFNRLFSRLFSPSVVVTLVAGKHDGIPPFSSLFHVIPAEVMVYGRFSLLEPSASHVSQNRFLAAPEAFGICGPKG